MGATVLKLNRFQRTLSSMFPAFFTNTKHDHYKDFGFPESLTFEQLHRMYSRNSLAKGAIQKTVGKTWQTQPFLLEKERDSDADKETPLEAEIRTKFSDLRVWAKLREADARSMVGRYSGVILQFRDNGKWDQPVNRITSGLEGLKAIIPVWEGQLTVAEWVVDPNDENYGDPKFYQFTESAVPDSGSNKSNGKQNREIRIHPDRVIVWSEDATLFGRSALEAGFNDLVTLEKIVGAGGEGFWKNAKAAPVLEAEPEVDFAAMAKSLNTTQDKLVDRMNEQVDAYNQGFDKLLMLQGMKANQLNVTLPSPEHFFGIALQSFAASMEIPLKILIGSQSGERASTEDANEWAMTNNSRRENFVVPNIMLLVNRLEQVGVLPEQDWFIDWTDLTESTITEKIDRAAKMADINAKMQSSGEWVFTPEEMRAAADYEPLSEADALRDDPQDEDPDPGSEDEV